MLLPSRFLTIVLVVAGCSEARMTADQVLSSEQVIEALRLPLADLSKSVVNLQLPDERARGVFEPSLTVVDLADAAGQDRQPVLELGFERRHWPTRNSAVTVAIEDLSLWRDFLVEVSFFHHFNFYSVKGAFEAPNLYRSETGFKGLAQLTNGRVAAVAGKLGIDWKRNDETWRISRFETTEFHILEGPEPLFADVGDLVFRPSDWIRVAHSPHDENFIEMVIGVRSGETEMDELLASIRSATEAGTNSHLYIHQVAVVDVDRDGFDDLYVSGADAPAFFFRNRGNGRFEEISAELGLALDGVRSATFADFDNDGDSDAFLSFFNRDSAARYLRNEGGHFVDRTDTIPGGLPSWVLPIAVADYNNDGLLDVYLGTYLNAYLPELTVRDERAKAETGEWQDHLPWVDAAVAREVFRRLRSEGHPVSNSPGPPNWLLENVGGGQFRRAERAEPAEVFYNSLAVGWSDIDLDGDMDLYVVNESGPNQLLRNEGDGSFSDITTGAAAEGGFGMGLGFGDYDEDGRPDIYTTNMYSKAGMRIAEQMSSSEVIAQAARGNSLFRNAPDGFTKASSLDDSGIQVEAADFGFGGGFADFNNDGYLDIYAPAGFVTMPTEVATIGDS